MIDVTQGFLRDQLLERRRRLQLAIAASGASAGIAGLLNEVDAALTRMEAGTYGICEVCNEPVEPERLMTNPLLRLCLPHLTEEQQRRLEQDLELAAHMQRELLPKRHLDVEGWQVRYHYQPLQLVSGDYCDVIACPNQAGGFYFMLGDASGKGVAASMLMAQLHGIVKTLVADGLGVPELMERASRAFCESTLAPYFATMACGRVGRDGQMEICNAGHCPPLILRAGKITRIETTGLPLGLFCNGQYSCQCLNLDPGDFLVLYTDGLSESRNSLEEEYGEHRLSALVQRRAALPPESLISAILDDVALFGGGIPASDDLAVMIVRRTPSVVA